MFGGLRQQWLKRVHAWDLVPRLVSHVATSSEVPLLCDEEVASLREDLRLFLSSKGLQCSSNVPSGQPLALHLLRGMLLLSEDVDAELPIQLERGVPTGMRETIPASGVWRPVEVPERPPVELLTWQEPWSSGRQDPDTVLQLVQEDVDLGFAEWLPGGLAEARARFGTACAAGRLGLVKKEGSAPRLVGDSTVSGANLLCRIGERIEMPSLQDVSESLSRDPDALWTAFIMDVSKAHKRVKVAPEDCGFSLFAIIDSRGETRWIMSKTCHFGGAWSAYWWSRAAGTFTRIAHKLLHIRHFLAVYVDDNFALFPRSTAPLCASLLLCLALALGLPLSWRKLRLGTSLRWIGWDIFLESCPAATLPLDKRKRLLEMLAQFCVPLALVQRRDLEKCLGLLCWFTSALPSLRPWLQALFQVVHKPAILVRALDAKQLADLRACVDDKLVVVQKPRRCPVSLSWRALEIAHKPVASTAALQCSGPFPVWVKFGNPASAEVRVSREAAEAAAFYRDLIQLDVAIRLVQSAGPRVVAAADAFAEGDRAGVALDRGGRTRVASCLLGPHDPSTAVR